MAILLFVGNTSVPKWSTRIRKISGSVASGKSERPAEHRRDRPESYRVAVSFNYY